MSNLSLPDFLRKLEKLVVLGRLVNIKIDKIIISAILIVLLREFIHLEKAN